MKFNSKVIHAGVEADPTTGAIMTPIYQTSTYIQHAPGDHKGYEYARTQNPTRRQLENALAELEEGKHGIAFGSGMAAIDAICKILEPGDEVIATNDLYGGSYRIFTTVFAKYGIKFHFVPMQDLQQVADAINEKTRMIWVETPTNPMLTIVDIKGIARLARERRNQQDILVVADNTFASPYLQQPLNLGADVVIHSATKYLGGHSDTVLGSVVTTRDDVGEFVRKMQNTCGGVPGPQDCFLVLRGLKTLAVRVRQHCENAHKIARMLRDHDAVKVVYYPGFREHPNHNIAADQMRDFGGMVSFSLKVDDMEAALKVLQHTHLFTLAESLGGVESLIGHPATMTHASIPKEIREQTGVVDSLIRLSVGIEDVDDLVDDLEQALNKVVASQTV